MSISQVGPQIVGAWAAYGSDDSYNLETAIFPTEVEALRHALDNHMRVVYLPFGSSLRDAIATPQAPRTSGGVLHGLGVGSTLTQTGSY